MEIEGTQAILGRWWLGLAGFGGITAAFTRPARPRLRPFEAYGLAPAAPLTATTLLPSLGGTPATLARPMIRPAHTTMDVTDDTLALFITVRTLPGRRDDVMALWEEHLKERAADNRAQKVYFYCFNRTDEDVIHIFEVYDDLDAFEEAGESDWFQAYMEEVEPLLAGPVDVSMATPKWAKLPGR